LLIPWVAIELIALRVAGRDPADNDPARSRSSAIEGAVARAPVTLRAEVASCELPVEEVLSLAPGSVVRLGGRADRGIALFVEQVALGRAVPGANGPRRAVQGHSADGMGT
jgi:flagellar motor switch protein FliM